MKTIGQICFENVQQCLNAALGIGLAPSGGYGWGDLTPEQQRAWEKAAAATVAASPRPDTTPPMRTPGRVFYEAAQPKRREWNIDYDRLSGPSREALETGARAVLDAFPPGNLRDQLDHKLRMEQKEACRDFLKAHQLVCPKSPQREVERARDAALARAEAAEAYLKDIAHTYCGVDIGGETTLDMVRDFVEGAIDRQSDRAERAEKACAAKDACLRDLLEVSDLIDDDEQHQTKAIERALSADCGKGYAPKAELEAARPVDRKPLV